MIVLGASVCRFMCVSRNESKLEHNDCELEQDIGLQSALLCTQYYDTRSIRLRFEVGPTPVAQGCPKFVSCTYCTYVIVWQV